MKYTGSCHCGKVAYEVEGEIDRAMACNCSICQRKGSLLWFVPMAQFRVRTPDEAAGTYLFNKHTIKHRYCPECGCSPYSEGIAPSGNYMVVINARCLDGVDLSPLKVGNFDGRSL